MTGTPPLRVLILVMAVAPAAPAQVSVTTYRFGPPRSTFVYLRGRDTVAIDRSQLMKDRFRGSMVLRTPDAVILTSYYGEYASDGRVVLAEFSQTLGDGSRLPDRPMRVRLHLYADSAVRETAWPDSTRRETFVLRGGTVAFPDFIYGPTQLLGAIFKASNGFVDSIPAIAPDGDAGYVGLELLSGDTLRLRGQGAPVRLVFEKLGGILLAVDGSRTEHRVLARLSVAGGIDVEALARRMTPLPRPR